MILKIKKAIKVLTRQCNGSKGIKGVVGFNSKDYFEDVNTCYSNLANPFRCYKQLVDGLIEIDQLQIIPLYELMSRPTNGTRVIGLRHDIDADPITGLRCARYLAQKGICGSFYFLFTSPYYGTLYDKLFVRNPDMEKWLLSYIVTGCEIGVHNDCLKLYMDNGINGAIFLKQELEWLRSTGAVIRGTVSHNTGASYGAENSEIFTGRVLWNRKLKYQNGPSPRLGSISEKALGLTYEGSFIRKKHPIDLSKAEIFFSNNGQADVRSESWMRQYLFENPCFDWELNYQFWLVGQDKWVISGRHKDHSIFEFDKNIDRVIEVIDTLPAESRSVIVIHPSYVRQNNNNF